MDEHVLPQAFSPRSPRANWLVGSARQMLVALWCKLTGNFRIGYQPERHYMRGPGPKWRERNSAGPARSTLKDPA